MKHVWICQCLCPSRHCIMAAANEAESEKDAQRIRTELRYKAIEWLKSGALNPWCAMCGANCATWRYELRRTVWASMEEAMPTLRQTEAENVAANLVWGDLHLKTKPN